MKYKSTRSSANTSTTFKSVVLSGLAPDGGLFIPTEIPRLTQDEINSFVQLSYTQLAQRLFRLFIDREEIGDAELQILVEKTYGNGHSNAKFDADGVAPVTHLDGQLLVLELFHGPTLAFKDVALQFLGNLFEFFLTQNASRQSDGMSKLCVVGATSGDTGGAAIHGLRGKDNVQVFILHPHNKISAFQRVQMCGVSGQSDNVHNIAVEGSFDDCQHMVKKLFLDHANKAGDDVCFGGYGLGAVNSFNWARILAQITYYFYAYAQVRKAHGENARVSFSVPTGNFGDILAGFYARQMGLPIDQMLIATNANDILYRFFKTGIYECKKVNGTIAPAMDIQVSSNFERWLWYFAKEQMIRTGATDTLAENMASEMVTQWMCDIATAGSFRIPPPMLEHAQRHFQASRSSDDDIRRAIGQYAGSSGVVLDPHTAVGVDGARNVLLDNDSAHYIVCLATAHPLKFLPAVFKGIQGRDAQSTKEDKCCVSIPKYCVKLNSQHASNGNHSNTLNDEELEHAWFSGKVEAPIKIPVEYANVFEQRQDFVVVENQYKALRRVINEKLHGKEQ